MFREIVRPSLTVFVALTVLCGVVYPLLVTGAAQIAFHDKAEGSFIVDKDGKAVGSTLIGQPFTEAKYFWERPSATLPSPYNASASSGSNLGPTNPALVDSVRARVEAVKATSTDKEKPVPIDLVTASASGLDPHISLAAAEYQVARVAKARSMTEEAVMQAVARHTLDRTFGLLGEPCVNVLELNLDLETSSH